MVERPTAGQLRALAGLVSDGFDEFDDDPALEWPRKPGPLAAVVSRRRAIPDWYGDPSDAGKTLWEGVVFQAGTDRDLGFRVDSDGVYRDVIETAGKALGVRPVRPGDVALTAFGTRHYGSHPPENRKPRSGDWTPMHSMHPPDEAARMRTELRAVSRAVEPSDDQDALEQYADELMPAAERVADDERLPFIQVDT